MQNNVPLTVYATCDNVLALYADGELVASSSDWTATETATLDHTPRVLAVDCLDQGEYVGILVSASNGLHTDGSWRCSRTNGDNWNKVRKFNC